ncbi:MAG TPA: hypothetical protein VEF72_19000 [Mycobacterium sp.]|nr:hypothetical protein [Mycobacterium sp.]
MAVELPAIGKLGLPAIENKLSARDIRSAWRLLPDLQVGIVHLRGPATPDTLGSLIAVLRQAATTRVGISPPFHDPVRNQRRAEIRPPGGHRKTVGRLTRGRVRRHPACRRGGQRARGYGEDQVVSTRAAERTAGR